MPIYTISAYQEMFAEHSLEANNEDEAELLFRKLAREEGVAWRKGDEDLEIADISVNGEPVERDV
jgi:hypothetical protein